MKAQLAMLLTIILIFTGTMASAQGSGASTDVQTGFHIVEREPEDEDAMTLNEALKRVGDEETTRIRLSDDFSALSTETDCGNFSQWDSTKKAIIVMRRCANVEYETLDEKPDDSDGLYYGKAVGDPKVYLCCDAMREMPEELRAQTLDEVSVVIMIESVFICDATIITSELISGEEPDPQDVASGKIVYLEDGTAVSFKKVSEDAMRDENGNPISAADMTDQQKREIGTVLEPPVYNHTYHPIFGGALLSTLYDLENGGWTSMGSTWYDHNEMRTAPEAGAQQDRIAALHDFFQAFNELGTDWPLYAGTYLEMYYAEDDADRGQLQTALESGDYAEVCSACGQIADDVVSQLMTLDEDNESSYGNMYQAYHAEEAPIALSEYLDRAYAFSNLQEYRNVDVDDVYFRFLRRWQPVIPDADMESMLDETVTTYQYVDWDWAAMSAVIAYVQE